VTSSRRCSARLRTDRSTGPLVSCLRDGTPTDADPSTDPWTRSCDVLGPLARTDAVATKRLARGTEGEGASSDWNSGVQRAG
jgi:hypothetical protein